MGLWVIILRVNSSERLTERNMDVVKGLGSISLGSITEMKEELVKLDLIDLQNLKGDINAQYDFHKTMSFVFSLMISFLS
ncbi:hypothetical protein [Paenibacillus sp. NPDC055715]